MSLVNRRISIVCKTMSNRCKSVFDIPEVCAELSELQEKCVVVPADKASNNIVFVCKTHYVEELGLNTYTPSPLSRKEILDNHDSVMLSLGISVSKEDLDRQNCIGFRNYTRILTNSTILRVLRSVQQSPSLRFSRESSLQ